LDSKREHVGDPFTALDSGGYLESFMPEQLLTTLQLAAGLPVSQPTFARQFGHRAASVRIDSEPHLLGENPVERDF
jgi:hypothetical protein